MAGSLIAPEGSFLLATGQQRTKTADDAWPGAGMVEVHGLSSALIEPPSVRYVMTTLAKTCRAKYGRLKRRQMTLSTTKRMAKAHRVTMAPLAM
eukprot:474330-Prymnesium_polylepis.1